MVMVLGLALAAPAVAQTADSARGEAFGAEVSGAVTAGPLPELVAAEVPPGEEAQAEVLEIPVEPVVFSATLSAEANAAREANLAATLQAVMEGVAGDLPDTWNSRGYAITEDLEALMLETEGVGLIGADVVEAEAVVHCDGTTPVFSTGSRIQNLTFTGPLEPVGDLLAPIVDQVVELIVQGEPNEDVLANVPVVGELLKELGLEVIAWETNWDSSTGTLDNSDTVWVNALRISVTEGSPLSDVLAGVTGEERLDIEISHGEATAACGPAALDNPLRNVSKASSADTVAPGETFTYTITVPNASATCTLNDVDVTDTITGPGSVVGTEPQADSVDGLTVVWRDRGPIAPGANLAFNVQVRVNDDAPDGALFREQVRVTALCDGAPVEGGVDFDGPRVRRAEPPLPVTGPAVTATGGLVLMLLGAAGLGRRRSILG